MNRWMNEDLRAVVSIFLFIYGNGWYPVPPIMHMYSHDIIAIVVWWWMLLFFFSHYKSALKVMCDVALEINERKKQHENVERVEVRVSVLHTHTYMVKLYSCYFRIYNDH